MKRTTVFLEERIERELDLLARERGEPRSLLIREALTEYVVRKQPHRRRSLAFIASGASDRPDVAEHHEELLWREPHAPPIAPGPSRRRLGPGRSRR